MFIYHRIGLPGKWDPGMIALFFFTHPRKRNPNVEHRIHNPEWRDGEVVKHQQAHKQRRKK